MSEPIRLSKRVVAVTGCSRRDAERYIEGGHVLVDGVVVDEPQFMVADQVVALAPGAKPEPVEPATLLLHRAADTPDNALDAAARSSLDATGIRPLRRHLLRLQEGLALEPGAGGLVVLTQDGRLLRRFDEDGDRIEQEFVVEVAGALADDGLARLARGIAYAGRPPVPAKASWQGEGKLRFALKGARPGLLAAMCTEVGLEVVGIKRLRIGRVPLGPMAPGEWRYLAPAIRF
jgi:23S rRNA pseudouridine2604 synthase